MAGVTAASLLKTIRKHCLECCEGSAQEVKNCASGPDACALWKYRLGVNPEVSEAKREAGRKAYERNLANKIQTEAELNHT